LILIHKQFSKKRFDFGSSNEEEGLKLRVDLGNFGASTIVHDFYEVEN
jgi:hypothetical protein